MLESTGSWTTTCCTRYRNPIRVFDVDELVMLIGPDQSSSLLEIGVAHAEGIDFIVHAMTARPKFLE